MKTNYFENCIAFTLLLYPTENMKLFQAACIRVSLPYDFTLRCIEKAHNMVYRQLRDQYVMPEISALRSLHHHVHNECYHTVLRL